MEHKGYYAIIPANVRYDKNLTPNAKLLYGEITALCNEKGFCWANNDYFAELYGVSKTSITKWINSLVDNGYIAVRSICERALVETLKGKMLHGHGIGVLSCEWCGIKTTTLHSHHYPVPRRKGGDEVVDICPNCHNEFHYPPSIIELNVSNIELAEILKSRGGEE